MKIELFKDKSGKWRFRARANNGRILASSEAYSSRANVRKGAKSLKRGAVEAKIVIVN
jgi:hypothetical protein